MAAGLDIVGGVGVDVVPVIPNFHTKLKAIVLPIADRVGAEAGKSMGEKLAEALGATLQAKLPSVLTSAMNTAGSAAQRSATRQGEQTGGAFARSLKAKLEAAFKAMPKLDVKLSDTGVDAELARLRAKLESLSSKRIGIDIDAATADAKVAELDAQLARLGASSPNVAVRMDTATARAALAQFREEIRLATAKPWDVEIRAGSFREKIVAQVEAAQAALPSIRVDVETPQAEARLAGLRAELAAIPNRLTTDANFDDAAALAKIAALQVELTALNRRGVDINVRVDAAAAEAELAVLAATVASLDETKRVNVDASGATSALMGLGIQMAILTAIPLGPVLAAGIGAIAAAATAAGAGVGALALVALPAVKGVTAAITAKSAADKDAAHAANKSSAADTNAAIQAQQRALQIAGAQASLSSAYRSAAQSIAAANKQVEQAERAVADAVQQAADQRKTALDGVVRAERSLSDANRAARQAEQDLTQARADAAAQLKALNNQLIDGALSQRDATLRVQQAQNDLNATLADPRSTQLQIDQAQLSYDQAVQAAKEQKSTYADLQKSAAAQKKAGVDGNAAVKTAAQQLADAQRNVADQTQAVADAQANVVKVTAAGARSIADAQVKVSDAVKNAAATQVTAAESIASAERSLESARLSSSKTTADAITKADAYQTALDKLSPSARNLFDAIAGPKGLTPAFKDWSKSLQPDVLPLLTRAVDGMKNSLPGLTPLVHAAVDGVKQLQDSASNNLKDPFWQGFKHDIATSATPAIVGLGKAFGNIIKGMAGIVDAFLPHMDGISQTMQRITKRFANWGSNLKGSPDFERFLQYVKDNGPKLAEFLGNILGAVADVSKALSPLSTVMFGILNPIVDSVSWIAINLPGVVQILWGLYAVNKAIELGMAAFAVAMGLYNTAVALAGLETWSWAAAIQATGIVPLIELIVLAVAALVIGIVEAYKHVGWFRAIVDGAWTGIKIATIFLWEKILKPAFDGIWWAMKKVGAAAVWLWQNAISPAFSFIDQAARILVTAIIVLLIAPVIIAFKLMAATATWLWEHAIRPAFRAIGDLGVWLYNKALKPAFDGIATAAKWLYRSAIKPSFDGIATVAKWLYNKAIKPAFDGIATAAKWLYDKGIKPPFNSLKSAVKLVADAFGVAKDQIKKQWDALRNIAKEPIKFIIDHVYNKGIVPLWNKVADITGAGKLKTMDLQGFATGGIMSGYSPGRDDRVIAVGGGEAVMRPEWTRAVGADRINSWNAAARSGGIGGVQKAISNGMPAFAGGGIVDWFTGKAKSVGDFIGSVGSTIADPGSMWSTATDFIKNKMTGLADNGWTKNVSKIPVKMMDGLKGQVLNLLGFGGGGGGASWIKPVDVPYGTKFGVAGSMWSSGHHTGLDFPAAIGRAIHAVATGNVSMAESGGPYGKHVMINHGGGLSSLYAHMSSILTKVGKSVNQGDVIGKVGATGNVTGPHLHLEARLNGTAVDPMAYITGGGSGGFSGTAVGAAQTTAKNMLASYGWGANQFGPLQKLWNGESGWNYKALNASSGAYGIPQALPASKMASAGSDWLNNPTTQIKWGLNYIKNRADYGSPAAAYSKWLSRSPHWYDEGGYLPTGLNLVANGTGKPEPVFTTGQWDTLRAANGGGGGGATTIQADVKVFVGDREITDIVRTEITTREASTASAIDTGRWS